MNQILKNLSDEELMLAYQKGDKKAFDELVNRHHQGIYNFLYRLLGKNEQSAQEAFQEVFVRVVKAAENYIPTAKFTTWLYTIGRNYCIDQSRKGKFRKTISLAENQQDGNDNDKMNLEDVIADEKAKPEVEVSALNLAQKLEVALDTINPDQKEVFLLREGQGLSFDEIAQIVGTSVNTVKSRMRYAVLALQAEFKKLGITDR